MFFFLRWPIRLRLIRITLIVRTECRLENELSIYTYLRITPKHPKIFHSGSPRSNARRTNRRSGAAAVHPTFEKKKRRLVVRPLRRTRYGHARADTNAHCNSFKSRSFHSHTTLFGRRYIKSTMRRQEISSTFVSTLKIFNLLCYS